MKVLGIETATTVCAAAIVSDGTVLHEVSVDQKYVHAERLMGMVGDVLARSQSTLAGVHGIAVSIGPGSFTGLRIGLSVAKGLAYASDRLLIGVPTLEALAHRVIDARTMDFDGLILSALESRRDEVYCQLFRVAGPTLEPVWDERDLTFATLVYELGERSVTITGDACRKLRDMLPASPRHRYVEPGVAICSAASIALIGERLFGEGKADDAATLEPRYIKEFFSHTT